MSSFNNICGIYMDLPRILLTFGASLSFFCIGIIFTLFYYYKIPNLRRHPTTITIHKCWFELIFVSQFLWISFAPHSFFWKHYSTDDSDSCVTNVNIWPLAWLCQFSLLGGELWFAVLSMDIHQSLANPFTSYKVNARYYTAFVYGVAIFVATVFVSVVPIQYGLSVDPMIWVNVYNNSSEGRYTKFAVFYVFMIAIYVYCGITAIWARNQIYKGLEDTLAVRKYSVSKQTRYVIGYFLFWTCVFVLQFLNYLNGDGAKDNDGYFSDKQDDHIRSASAFLLASRGVWSLGIFLIANEREILSFFRSKREGLSMSGEHAAPPKVEQEQVQLNVALQTEIVRFTVLGIQRAIRDVEESANEPERLSGGAPSFFNRRTVADAFSFMISDPGDDGTARDTSESGALPSNNFSLTAAPAESESDPEEGHSPMRGLQLASSSAQSGADAAGGDSSARKDRDKDLSMQRSGSLFRRSEAINFALQDEEMIRQNSTSTGSVRSTHVSNNFINKLGNRIQRLTSSRRSTFMFTDYSPKHFAKMREVSGIMNEDYLDSFKSTTMPSFSEGRSGAFLYFSSDRKYIVKTTTLPEFEKLLQILPEYVDYFVTQIAQGHQPLITRFLGAHKIVMYDIPLYFVIMQNICPSVQEKYDLKGSWVNRHSSKQKDYNPKDVRPKKFSILTGDKQRSLNRRQDGAQLFLDNDLQNCFLLDPKVSRILADQVLRDIKLLAGFNLMDYSLLVGIKRRNFEVIDSAPSTPLTKSHLAATQQQQQQQQHPSLQSEKDSSDKAPRVSPLPNNHVPATPASSTTSTPTVNGRLNLAAVKDPDGAMHAAVVEGQGTFYIGIIDILQEWNYDKWYERMFKIYVLRKDGYGLSAMDPLNYRRRFYQRAVLDVFDGLGLDDADDGDIFERYSAAHFPVDGGDLRDTVDTSIASPRNTVGNKGDAGVAPAPSSPHSVLNLDNYYSTGRRPAKELERDSNLSLSESSSFSHEVQLQSLPSSSVSRDSVASVSLMGTDKRFTVKPFAK